jgi:hypothetical protein
VDRAALDSAIALGLHYGGWCPAGGWAEDYPVPPGLLSDYPFLAETPSSDPGQRTEWNVRDSDATLILACGDAAVLSPGTLYTATVACRLGKPCLVVSALDDPDRQAVAAFLASAGGRSIVLNVAGPRESQCPGIYARAKDFLMTVLRL